ncbi:CpsB/CapC family capsule biosynthesis tyrosine phosphatase [uncultured Lutibacter sp.]|uniref:tyrosine-protein phosphatase n=1 Tax=uncultured Lutibacter sp. TaxID=437739 RepID=UPI0026056CDD|nr:CpsB/CapC family capsule biosynthesis tyrosine phosphatase [uncultured Lutibacter sp.]
MLSLFKKKTPIIHLFPKEFVDIHCHLLSNIDDGTKSLNEAISLIKRMHNYGIKNFICTPHIMGGVWENSKESILTKLTELQNELNLQGLKDISIKAAAEYMLDENFDKLLKTKDLLTLKDHFILIELSYFNPPLNLYEQLFNIRIAGYKPILAHPERYSYFHHNFEEYSKLKEAGCLFQLNLLSLSKYYGESIQKTAFKLLKQGFIDFVGTDTHNNRHLNYLEKINNVKAVKMVRPILKNNVLFQ